MRLEHVLALTLGVAPGAAAESNDGKGSQYVVFDARSGGKGLHRCVGSPGADCRAPKTDFFDSQDIVLFQLVGAPCNTRWTFQLGDVAVPEPEPGIRGLGDMPSLAKALAGPPPAHGSDAPAAQSADSWSIEDILGRLVSREGIQGLRLDIEGEKARLESEIRNLAAAVAAYEYDVRIFLADAAVENAVAAVRAVEDAAGKPPAAGCSGAYQLREAAEMAEAELSRVEATITTSGLGSKASALQERLRVLGAEIGIHAARVDRARAAVEIARSSLGWECEAAPQTTSATECDAPVEVGLERLKRAVAAYGATATGEALRRIYDHYETERPRVRYALMQDLAKLGVALSSAAVDGQLGAQRESVRRSSASLETWGAGADDRVRDMRKALRRHFADSTYASTVDVRPRFTGNTVLSLKVRRQVFDPLAPPATEPPAAVEVASASYEVHKRYLFNVGGGFMISGIGNREYAVRQYRRLDADGQPVSDDDGPIFDKKLVESGSDARSQDFALTFTAYLPRRLDTFHASAARRPTTGLMVGFSLEKPTDNLYAGLVLQPTLGIQLTAGVHFGKRSAPQDGIVPEVTVLPADTTAPPIRDEWSRALFFSIGFDASVFSRLFGSSE
ncbi:MAG: hypothetical protein KJ067_14135 [Vicinamibacteria bacterium]|nr:hypothetical protein [Vicinamibacteria bacterium]